MRFFLHRLIYFVVFAFRMRAGLLPCAAEP
jgi:hypothetical protein